MNEFCDTAIQAARVAAKCILKFYDRIEVHYKASNNIVTQADHESEKEIVAFIRERYPDHQFLCEESHEKDPLDSPHLWIIDPLDGTNNYSRKIPQFCISIAYAESGQILAGVVFDPMRSELYHAIRHQGAFMNDQSIRVSETRELNQGIVGTGFYYDRDVMMAKTLNGMHDLFRSGICGIRRMGSAALDLCWVACGRYDAFFEYELSPWDFAAGGLIVHEAGGRISDRFGCPFSLKSQGIVAGNPSLHDQVLEIVRWRDT